ncbi:hypothetical protein Ddc_10789 [Ditylenchus destructor]|nr:hypothetical protein Ddc_10789 [Ditylenchus destructor]
MRRFLAPSPENGVFLNVCVVTMPPFSGTVFWRRTPENGAVFWCRCRGHNALFSGTRKRRRSSAEDRPPFSGAVFWNVCL